MSATTPPGDREHLVDLTGDFALWRDFAVRSAGFPVSGLEVFGAADESEQLARVAADPAFREAVAWQSRESLARAVDKHANGVRQTPSQQRRREQIVASYWQRYCAKNDTIGFFGPLGWGTFSADEPDAVVARVGALERERVVHLETWAVEAIAAAAGLGQPLVAMGPFPERDLRSRLAGDESAEACSALGSLDRLLAARDALAAAPRESLVEALGELDRVFEDETGRPPVRGDDDSGGGRTIAYLDSMRDLDVTLGRPLLDELRGALTAIFYASRWWTGRVFAAGREKLASVAAGQDGPLGPMIGPLMGSAWDLWSEMGEEQRELQRRWATVAEGGAEGIAARAAEAFADHEPAWRYSRYESADIQIAAPDVASIARGNFLVVLGDFHGGDNPLGQGLFALRPPAPGAIAERIAAEVGPGIELLPQRRGVVPMTARAFPVYAGEGNVVVLAGDEPAPPGTRGVNIGDVVIQGGSVVTDGAGSFSLPLEQLLFLPIFVAAIRSFDLIGSEHTERVTIGRTVIRRASWSVPLAELPATPDEYGAWARDRGLPRRVFARSPVERKPVFVDFESPSLRRMLARRLAPAVEQAPEAAAEFTEMLPGPDECWLESDAGHYTSELRIVALDRSTHS